MATLLELDSSVYFLEAVQKAAYRFIDRLTVLISQTENKVVCEIEPVPGLKLSLDEVLADFKIVMPPDDHSPPSLIAKQLQLVDATKTEIRIAEREEWRARSQRHKWLSERVDMATRISIYDLLLVEAWEDKHALMTEQTEIATDAQKRSAGLEIFRWSFNDAKAQIAPFANNWSADYYVRGCYQFLAVDLKVGWHPDFRALLRSEG